MEVGNNWPSTPFNEGFDGKRPNGITAGYFFPAGQLGLPVLSGQLWL